MPPSGPNESLPGTSLACRGIIEKNHLEETKPIRSTSQPQPTVSPQERALLVGIELRERNGRWTAEDSLEELAQLARTAGAQVVGSALQRLRMPSPAHYIGSGKLEEIVALRAELGADLIIFDDELSPTQQRNLEEALKVKVLDRTALILDIFARRARTHEGRLQVELAQHEYLLPRLAGQWTHLERLGGGIGTRGPGETQLETDRRAIRHKIAHLKDEIERVRRHRALHRQNREREGLPVVALVGYTNAGKSTLLNALTGADVLVENKLFATLDPTTRRLDLPSRRAVLLSDTVGFIQKLPTTLVAAFRATLEELAEADLLVHVVDLTHPNAAEQSQTVETILGELGLADKPMLVALNKADALVADEGALAARQVDVAAGWRGHGGSSDLVLLSAARGWGLVRLLDRIEDHLGEGLRDIAVRVPYGQDELVSLFREQGTVLQERFNAEGTFLAGRIPARLWSRLAPFRVVREA